MMRDSASDADVRDKLCIVVLLSFDEIFLPPAQEVFQGFVWIVFDIDVVSV